MAAPSPPTFLASPECRASRGHTALPRRRALQPTFAPCAGKSSSDRKPSRIWRRWASLRKARPLAKRPRRPYHRTEMNRAPCRRWGTRPCRRPRGYPPGFQRRNRKQGRSCRRRSARIPHTSRSAPGRPLSRPKGPTGAAGRRGPRIGRPSAAAPGLGEPQASLGRRTEPRRHCRVLTAARDRIRRCSGRPDRLPRRPRAPAGRRDWLPCARFVR